MALDLSVRGQNCGYANTFSQFHSRHDLEPLKESSQVEDSNNNNSLTAINLTKPKSRHDENENDSQLSPQQIQLDIAALNLLCLARLQETAAVLTGRRPLPAHMNSSSFPLVTNSNRRNHRCDEPGCDKASNFALH